MLCDVNMISIDAKLPLQLPRSVSTPTASFCMAARGMRSTPSAAVEIMITCSQ